MTCVRDQSCGLIDNRAVEPSSATARRRRTLALAVASLALAISPAPAGTASLGCGLAPISDPGLRASFERLDRRPSAASAKVCAIYLNNWENVSAAP